MAMTKDRYKLPYSSPGVLLMPYKSSKTIRQLEFDGFLFLFLFYFFNLLRWIELRATLGYHIFGSRLANLHSRPSFSCIFGSYDSRALHDTQSSGFLIAGVIVWRSRSE